MYIFGKDGIHISGSRSRTGYYRYDGTGDVKVEITYLGDWEQVSINPYNAACGHLKIDNITYPLHVPFMTSTSNPDDFIHGDGWSDILTPKIETKLDINWWAIVAGINPPNSVDLQVASDIGIIIAQGLSCFSFIMGLIGSATANTTALKLKAYRQSNGSENRALLIYDTSALSAYNYAGKSFLFQSEIEKQAREGGYETILDPAFKSLYQEWLKFTFNLPDKEGRKHDIEFTFDSGHKNNPGVGFVYKNIYDELMLRAFRLQGDFIKIVYIDDFWSGYKELKDITYIMEVPAKLTGQTKTYVEEILTKLNATLIKPN